MNHDGLEGILATERDWAGQNVTGWDERSRTQKPLGGNARVGSNPTFGTKS